MGAAPLLARLLSAAPQLKLLVTSQALLRLRAEREYPVGPLALPSAEHLPLAQLARTPAVALFLERAQGGQAGLRAHRAERGDGRRDLPALRRAAAGDRADGCP